MHRRLSAQLPRGEWDCLLRALTKFLFSVECDRGWNYAEVTAGGVPLRRDQPQDHGIQAGVRPLSDRGDPRLRRTDRRLQLSMGLGHGIARGTGGINMCACRRRGSPMSTPFLSTRLPHGTFVCLTERRGSSIRGQERAWLSGKSEHGN